MPAGPNPDDIHNCQATCHGNPGCMRNCLERLTMHTAMLTRPGPGPNSNPGSNRPPSGRQRSPWVLRRADGQLQWLSPKARPTIVQEQQAFDAATPFAPNTPEFHTARAAFFAERGLVLFEIGNLVQASKLAPDDVALQNKLSEALQKITST